MSYASEVLADSPLLYLRMEETSGATCANDGSLAGSATAHGSFTRNISTGLAGLGVATSLPGAATAYIDYPDTASLDITGDVTYECWVAVNSFAVTSAPVLMSKGRDSASVFGYALRVTSAGQTQVLQASTAIIFSVASSFPTSLGVFHQVAFTRATNLFTIYVDGSSVGSTTVASTVTATAKPFMVGADQWESGINSFINGYIDEAAVYSTALSGARIAAHYAARSTAGGGSTFVPQIVML